MNEEEQAGRSVFEGRADEILAGKIVNHSQQTASAEPSGYDIPASPELSEPYQEQKKTAPRKRVWVPIVTAVLVCIGLILLLMRLKQRDHH